jgi:hypothetical protein
MIENNFSPVRWRDVLAAIMAATASLPDGARLTLGKRHFQPLRRGAPHAGSKRRSKPRPSTAPVDNFVGNSGRKAREARDVWRYDSLLKNKAGKTCSKSTTCTTVTAS